MAHSKTALLEVPYALEGNVTYEPESAIHRRFLKRYNFFSLSFASVMRFPARPDTNGSNDTSKMDRAPSRTFPENPIIPPTKPIPRLWLCSWNYGTSIPPGAVKRSSRSSMIIIPIGIFPADLPYAKSSKATG